MRACRAFGVSGRGGRLTHSCSIATACYAPSHEYSSLRAQLRKAAESIPTNIVEGCGCHSNREFARFLQHSINSADETEYHLLIARDYGALRHREWVSLTEDVQEVRKMLISLRRKVIEAADR